MYNGGQVAVKEIDLGRGVEAHESFVTEVRQLINIRQHPHIVSAAAGACGGSMGRGAALR